MTAQRSDRRLQARVDDGRRLGFVGRGAAIAQFDDALRGSPHWAPAVIFVHGPGGIGKTTLVREFRRRAEAAGRVVVFVDGRDVDTSPEGFEFSVSTAAGIDNAEGDPFAGVDDPVLIVDSYEFLSTLDRWLRDRYLPYLPGNTLVVLAGRDAPTPGWRADPGWRDAMWTHLLEPLDQGESDQLLGAAGVDAATRPRLTRLGRGHPLALSLLADVAGRRELTDDLAGAPDLVAELLQVFARDIPDDTHRRGLLTCAHAWVTTEDLLRDTVGAADARRVWDWLAGLSFVVRGPKGLYPHDLARETVDADLRTRAPDAYAELHHQIREHIVRQLRSLDGPARFDAAYQLHYLHRAAPMMQQIVRSRGAATPLPASPDDQAVVLDLVERHEGKRTAAIFDRWLRLPVAETWVIHGADGLVGFTCDLAVHDLTPEQREIDPVVGCVLDHVDQVAPAREGEEILVSRWFGGVGGPTDASAVLCGALVNVTEWVARPLAWAWVASTAPDLYRPLFEYLGFTDTLRVDGPEGAVEVYGMDWRRFPVDAWLDLMEQRELTGESGPPPADRLRPPPIGPDAFATAVRDALRDYHRDDRLAANPLAGTRLGARDPAARSGVLRAHLDRAIHALGGDRRGDTWGRVLDRTYVHAAPTQEAAAEVLDLPFSTYRRHLGRAIERVTDMLWAEETGGTASDS